MTETVLLSRENQIATLTFNRPHKMNAFNRMMADELENIIEEVKHDSSIRLLVLRGAGDVFMAGSDLYEFHRELSIVSTEAMVLIRHFNASIMALREMDKPVLACVHGLVTGTGMSFMLAADLVIAEESTQFSLGFTRMAISPVGGISYYLPRLLGTKKAIELLLMSDDFDAKTAEQLGLVNWIFSAETWNEKTNHIIERLLSGPLLAYVRTKQLLNSAWQNKIATQLELEADAFVKSVGTRDFKSAVRAFVNKRPPEFEGR